MNEKIEIFIQKIKNLFLDKLSEKVEPELWEGSHKSLAELETSKMVKDFKKSNDKLCFEYYYGGNEGQGVDKLCREMKKNLKKLKEDVDYYDSHN